MSDELKPCPSCGSIEPWNVLHFNTGRRQMICQACLVAGPSVQGEAEAKAAWDALPRRGESSTPAKPGLVFLFDVRADRLSRFQSLLAAAGNAPEVESIALTHLACEMVDDDSLHSRIANEIRGYLGLGTTAPEEQESDA